MNKIKLKTTIIIVILFVMLSTVLSFAAPTIFTDIDGHWAKEYIEDVYRRQIITGYPDATFKPQGDITKLETIVTIAKLMGYSDDEGQYYINQYKQKLEDNNIPDWAQGTVAYALFNDILSEEELESLVSVSGQTHAKRYEVAIYIGRVLQYGAGEELEKIYVIPYKDEMSISNEAKPYVNLLLNKKILDEFSNDGRFLPNNEITRAEVAKLISLSAKILDDVSDGDINVEPGPIISPDKKVLEGYFLYCLPGYGQTPEVFFKDNKKDEIHSLLFTDDSRVYFMDKAVDIEELEQGDTVIITYVDDEIIEIKARPKEEYFEGTVKAKDSDKGKYSLQVLLEDKTIETFAITSEATLRRDRRYADFEDIKIGDEVEITTEYGTVISVNAFGVKKTVEGYIKKIVIGQKVEITIEKYDETMETFTLTPNTVIRVEKERKGIYDLRLNHEVELEIENDEVLWIEAYRRLQDSNYGGRVTYIDNRRKFLGLQTGVRDEIEIYVDDETIYNDENGDIIGFRDIYVGDEIGVFVEVDGYYIIAKRVFVITRR